MALSTDILAKEKKKANTGLVTGTGALKTFVWNPNAESLLHCQCIYLHHPLDYKVPHTAIAHIFLIPYLFCSQIQSKSLE